VYGPTVRIPRTPGQDACAVVKMLASLSIGRHVAAPETLQSTVDDVPSGGEP
jgi:hypothetical protein